MAEYNIPAKIRRICAEWSYLGDKHTMGVAGIPGSTTRDLNMIDLLLETTSCLCDYELTEKQEERLRTVQAWVLSEPEHWIIYPDRGAQFDRSKGLENG